MIRSKWMIFTLLFFILFLSSSCSLDPNCTLEGRPSVCFTFEDKNGSPVFPEHVAYTIKDPQYTEVSSYEKHPELLKSIIDFESNRQISKKELLTPEGEDLSSISLGPTIDGRRMGFCIDNSITGTYTSMFKFFVG